MKHEPSAQAIINGITDPAILLSRDYQILFANPAYEAVYGDGRSLRARHCYEVSHGNSVPCDQAGEQCPLKQCLESRQIARVLHVHHTPRGQEYVNVETWPVSDDAGEPVYFIEVLRPSNIAKPGVGDGLIGKSRAFQEMLGFVDRVAPTQTNVLLLGESGTGKEVVARTIHERSQRRLGPFVPVECTGLPETLFESELFGHEKGAFTGASAAKPGLVEAAAGGTLFLDEVGDIPLGEQVKLLRLLETRQFRRVGSTEPRMSDFRLVCATNKNLVRMVQEGQFREDLFFRLSVFEVVLPPLRVREGDVAVLVQNMLLRADAALRISPEALECLERYAFPGNIRELRNAIERAAIMCDGDTILPEHLPQRFLAAEDAITDAAAAARHAATGISSDNGNEPALKSLADVETEYLRFALRHHHGDRRALAEKLGISERALYRKLSKLRHQ